MPDTTSVSNEIRTARLLLRPWRAGDAVVLQPVLEANRDHLGPWIPARVAEPASIAVLAERLEGFAVAFAADREWRYAILALDGGRMLGEVSLFPRSAEGRVPYPAADRGEIGYWLRADATGRGLATEASQAMLDLAMTLQPLAYVEIRCDARNAVSLAIPRRLGFVLSTTVSVEGVAAAGAHAEPVELQVWTRRIQKSGEPMVQARKRPHTTRPSRRGAAISALPRYRSAGSPRATGRPDRAGVDGCR